MTKSYRPASLAALFLPILLAGCSLFPTTRKLPVPKAPTVTQTVTPEKLVAQLNDRWNALHSLTAKVNLQLSVTKTQQGVATDYTTIGGVILIRKPEMLRVYGRYPVIGTRMFDMVSDGKNFTLYVPHNNKEYKGSNTVTKKSTSLVENMRPGFFFDAMVIRGLEADDQYYMVTTDTITVEDPARKHLYSVPEYILTVMRPKPGSHEMRALRRIYFHRDDLLPYQQDVYDNDGNLETQVTYAAYQDFDSTKYPSAMTIKRPLDEFQIILTVESVQQNQTLEDNQFVINDIPEGTQIQKLD